MNGVQTAFVDVFLFADIVVHTIAIQNSSAGQNCRDKTTKDQSSSHKVKFEYRYTDERIQICTLITLGLEVKRIMKEKKKIKDELYEPPHIFENQPVIHHSIKNMTL
ncbi:hypothetical protein ACJX0J_006012, partial [Zea mays]